MCEVVVARRRDVHGPSHGVVVEIGEKAAVVETTVAVETIHGVVWRQTV